MATRRVTLYSISPDAQWTYTGTGYASCISRTDADETSLLVRDETDSVVLLESQILGNRTNYQRQTNLTILIKELHSNSDTTVLRFDRKTDCSEIWSEICRIRKHDETTTLLENQSSGMMFASLTGQLDELRDILDALRWCSANHTRRMNAISSLQGGWIDRLIVCFRDLERQRKFEELYVIRDIVRAIFLLNHNALFELLFSNGTIVDVMDCLEYDGKNTEFGRYRSVAEGDIRFLEFIPDSKGELHRLIRQTYQIQYMLDIVLPEACIGDEIVLSSVQAFVFCNKAEILTSIQDDEPAISRIFSNLTDDRSDPNRKFECLSFVKELCDFSKMLQLVHREAFYEVLIRLGIESIQFTLSFGDCVLKALSVDVLSCMVECHPLAVRVYLLEQLERARTSEHPSSLVRAIIGELITDNDLELAFQLVIILKALLNPEELVGAASNHQLRCDRTDFLNFFYCHCFPLLLSPIESDQAKNPSLRMAELLSYVLDLILFCVEHHTHQLKVFFLKNKRSIKKIVGLARCRHKFVALGAVRFFRRMISVKDSTFYRFIVKHRLMRYIARAYDLNEGRDNLLGSAIAEMLRFIKTENIHTLRDNIVENYSAIFEQNSSVRLMINEMKIQKRNKRSGDHVDVAADIEETFRSLYNTAVGKVLSKVAEFLDDEESETDPEDDSRVIIRSDSHISIENEESPEDDDSMPLKRPRLTYTRFR